MSDRDDGDDPRARRLIMEIRHRVQASRNQVWHELVNYGGVSDSSKRDLATAAVQYWDVLSEFRDDRADEWDEEGVDDLKTLLTEEVPVEVPSSGRSRATNTELRPAIVQVQPTALIEATKRLDKLAKSLGFSAAVKTRRDRFHIAKRDNEYPEPYNEKVATPE